MSAAPDGEYLGPHTYRVRVAELERELARSQRDWRDEHRMLFEARRKLREATQEIQRLKHLCKKMAGDL